MEAKASHRQILGINFYAGDVRGAIQRMSHGGLLVVPAAPALRELDRDASYREALENADLAITDSAFMVLLWNLLERDSLPRLSGLKYLHELLKTPDMRRPGNTFWIMAGPASAETNLNWLRSRGIHVPHNCVYEAPLYRGQINDPVLVDKINRVRPKQIVIALGGGVQERLGYYLKLRLDYLPGIHCIGAAIAFLSGDQVRIPLWADRFYLGWLFRCVSAPCRFIPRYWEARKLLPLLMRYRHRSPIEPVEIPEKSREAA